MPKVQEFSAALSSKGQVVNSSAVRRFKGRLAAPDAPVSVEDMNCAIAERRARIGGAR
jgi:hypothetical protein